MVGSGLLVAKNGQLLVKAMTQPATLGVKFDSKEKKFKLDISPASQDAFEKFSLPLLYSLNLELDQ